MRDPSWCHTLELALGCTLNFQEKKKGTVEFGRGYREERVGPQTCGGSLYTYHSSLSLNMPLDQGRCYCCFVADELFWCFGVYCLRESSRPPHLPEVVKCVSTRGKIVRGRTWV